MNAPAKLFLLAPLLGALFLGGCASFSADGGLAGVNVIAAPAVGMQATALRTPEDASVADSRTRALLATPLTASSAVELALLNNRNLQAAFNTLGISEASAVRASLPPNPTLSVSRVAGGGAFELETRLVASILDLATLPARANMVQDKFRQAQAQAALETVRIAVAARRAYFRTVASRALVGYLEQAGETGAAAATLAKRLGETGAMNKLDQARNQVFHAELVAQLATARQRAASDREALIRALGLWGNTLDFRLPAKLPPLPAKPRVTPEIEAEAVARRIDLQMARIEVTQLAKSYGLTNAARFASLMNAGPAYKATRESGDTKHEWGFDAELEIPLFDFGETKLREAEQTYMRAVNQLFAKAVTVRSEAREAYGTYRAAYDIARQYQRDVLPLRKIISDETLLRYNAMQIDVFSLLTEARQRITATIAALDATRDFWLADTNLGTALFGGGGPDAAPENMTPATTTADNADGGH